jgi:hypothetical protein
MTEKSKSLNYLNIYAGVKHMNVVAFVSVSVLHYQLVESKQRSASVSKL